MCITSHHISKHLLLHLLRIIKRVKNYLQTNPSAATAVFLHIHSIKTEQNINSSIDVSHTLVCLPHELNYRCESERGKDSREEGEERKMLEQTFFFFFG